MKTIYFAGGCFWGAEKVFKALPGVSETTVGYANGHTDAPTYQEVCTDTTGHRETVQVVYDPETIDLLRSMGASRAQIFRHVKFPGALGSFFSALRICVSYAVVGAVISEWLGGFEGLGVYMTRVKSAFAFDKMFAVIVVISVVSLILMGIVSLAERRLMPWTHIKERTSET